MNKVINLRKKEEPAPHPAPVQPPAPPSPAEPVKPAPNPLIQYLLETRNNLPATLTWQAPVVYRNSPKKHFTIFIAALFGIAILLFFVQGDILLPILFALSAGTMLLNASRKPTTAQITVNQAGIFMDDYHHRFKDLHSFHIHHHADDSKELSVRTAKWYHPYVKLPLGDQDPRQVRNLMLQFLPEEEHDISLIDHLARKI